MSSIPPLKRPAENNPPNAPPQKTGDCQDKHSVFFLPPVQSPAVSAIFLQHLPILSLYFPGKQNHTFEKAWTKLKDYFQAAKNYQLRLYQKKTTCVQDDSAVVFPTEHFQPLGNDLLLTTRQDLVKLSINSGSSCTINLNGLCEMSTQFDRSIFNDPERLKGLASLVGSDYFVLLIPPSPSCMEPSIVISHLPTRTTARAPFQTHVTKVNERSKAMGAVKDQRTQMHHQVLDTKKILVCIESRLVPPSNPANPSPNATITSYYIVDVTKMESTYVRCLDEPHGTYMWHGNLLAIEVKGAILVLDIDLSKLFMTILPPQQGDRLIQHWRLLGIHENKMYCATVSPEGDTVIYCYARKGNSVFLQSKKSIEILAQHQAEFSGWLMQQDSHQYLARHFFAPHLLVTALPEQGKQGTYSLTIWNLKTGKPLLKVDDTEKENFQIVGDLFFYVQDGKQQVARIKPINQKREGMPASLEYVTEFKPQHVRLLRLLEDRLILTGPPGTFGRTMISFQDPSWIKA